MGRRISNGYGYRRGSRSDTDSIVELDGESYRVVNDLVTQVRLGRTGYYVVRSVLDETEANRILEIYRSRKER